MFTYRYSQPEEYHFCQDSVIAPRVIAEDLPSPLAAEFASLDVCAGSGVMGFELAFHRPDIVRMDFLEIQDEFQTHFENNLRITATELVRDFRFICANYRDLKSSRYHQSYDLVIGNPPYFLKENGKLSHEPIRNRARFFLDASFEELISGVRHCLKPKGRAYFLVKSGALHGDDNRRLIRSLAWDAEVSVLADVRGTDLIRIIAPPEH